MKKLSLKLFLISILSFVCATAICMLVFILLNHLWLNMDFMRRTPFPIVIISIFGGFAVYYLLTRKMLVKRIANLNTSLKEVSKGNYDVELSVKGHDEISDLTTEFNRMTKELKANEYLNKEFIKNVSHELKTPISSIIGFSDLMVHQKLSNKEIKEYSEIILEEAVRLNDLCKQMLEISLLESTNIIRKEDVFRVDMQIRKVVLLMQKEWQDKNINLDVNLEEVEITGNEQLTYLIWMNLISNAIKYNLNNGNITINLSKKEQLVFEIIDTGIGISKENQTQIFNQFFTGSQSRNTKSTGLGLAITKKIVDKLNGKILLESFEEKGSKFVVELGL